MADDENLTSLTAELVSAYVANNSVPVTELPALLDNVHKALVGLGAPPVAEPQAPTPVKPAVSIRKSIADDHLVCLEDGEYLKSLKRHLQMAHGMTPAEYRKRWGLPKDYPMVAPMYARQRSAIAKERGLGGRKSSRVV